jgi:hypothetical protein
MTTSAHLFPSGVVPFMAGLSTIFHDRQTFHGRAAMLSKAIKHSAELCLLLVTVNTHLMNTVSGNFY